MFWFLVAPSFQQCASSGMCWRSYIQGFHLFHTKTDIHRHWRCQFPFLSFLQPPILHAWLGPTFQPEVCDEWKCVSSCPMPIFSRRLSDTTWCSTAPAEPKKNEARMWSKDKMGGSPITVHLQNKSYQFIQRWLINIYLFAVVKKYSCSFFNSIFSIGVIQFCIYIYVFIPFILLSTSGFRGSKGACFLHSYSSLESQIGWRFGRFSIWTSLKKTPMEKTTHDLYEYK